MQCRKLIYVTSLLIIFAYPVAAQKPSELPAGVEGVISISPTPPRMSREDTSTPRKEDVDVPVPLANASFSVTTQNRVVASFSTDEHGQFRVLVAPGHYTISQPAKSQTRRCGPWEVDVVAGQVASVEWYCEMGGAPE
jgi:hypothetical protein